MVNTEAARAGKKRSASVAFDLRPSLAALASARDAKDADAGPREQAAPKESKEYSQLRNIVEDTVQFGHGNSVLLIGPRGAGKSLLLKKVLADLGQEYGTGPDRKFSIVKLNGFVHSDDRLALREIMRQLMVDQQMENTSFGSFAEAFECLLGALGRGSTESLPIVFILEEFEVFTQQPRQTLLYNLFDTAQSSKNPVLVVGLATQLDVMELLEKRVKSRFNHRFLYILPSPSLEDFVEKGASIGRGEGEAHKAYLKTVLNRKECQQAVRGLHETSNSSQTLHLALAYCAPECVEVPAEDVAAALSATLRSQTVDSKQLIVKGLPPLGTQLIAAINNVRERSHTVNFEMVYDEYRENLRTSGFSGGGGTLQRKSVVKKVFEQLIECELLLPTSESFKGGRDYEMFKVMLPNF